MSAAVAQSCSANNRLQGQEGRVIQGTTHSTVHYDILFFTVLFAAACSCKKPEQHKCIYSEDSQDSAASLHQCCHILFQAQSVHPPGFRRRGNSDRFLWTILYASTVVLAGSTSESIPAAMDTVLELSDSDTR